MIIDLKQFIERGRGPWRELDGILNRLESAPLTRMSMEEMRRFHYLYERVSSDLAKLSALSSEQETRRYLESLATRAYGEIHESRRKGSRPHPRRWLLNTFPATFRRHAAAFRLACATMAAGSLFGALAVFMDVSAKEILMPFPGLMEHPSERVAREEQMQEDRMQGAKAQGAAWYMTHNTRVAATTVAAGVTWAVGTAVLLFFNGVMLGAVLVDYLMAGEAQFLFGWLLPHGATEIPAILLAGQAGFMLGGALIGWGSRIRMKQRLRRVSGDLVTLLAGVALLLVWSGIVEAFLSQYHAPVFPYFLKISLGVIEVILLVLWLTRAGRTNVPPTQGGAAG